MSIIFSRHNSLRLKGYDYSKAGFYFVTICVKNNENLFGVIINKEVVLNEFGQIAKACWEAIPMHFKHAIIDHYIIMPNHIHGIIAISRVAMCKGVACNTLTHGNNYSRISPKKGTLGVIIRSFKSAVTKKINILNKIYFSWHRSYYDHIIRDDEDLNRIREYIINNPIKTGSK